MRATTRTMWLLLSLSFLFQSVCSDANTSASNNNSSIPAINMTSVTTTATITNATTTTATTTTATITNATTTTATITNATITKAATPTPTTTKTEQQNKSMQATTTQSNKAVITSTINVAATTSRPTDTPAHTSQAPSTSKQSISDTITAAATSTTTPLKDTTITANPVTSPKALTTQMTESSGTSKTSVWPVNAETTKISKDLTVAPTQPSTGQSSSTTFTTSLSQDDSKRFSSTTKQEDSKGNVTEAGTIRNITHEQTTPTPPLTTVHEGTTSSPHTLTKTDYPATVTSGTTAGMSSQPAAITSTTAAARQEKFSFSLNSGHVESTGEKKVLKEVCKRMMVNLQDGNCSLTLQHSNGKTEIRSVLISGIGEARKANQYYEELTKKPTDNKTLIAILASCGALLIMIVILAVCASHHRKPFNENQQHLTEELHTVENGYHDNPTLEVMEVQPEMQEKKPPLNREFSDSWIVPYDNLLKEDIADEEDTHL